MQSATVLSPAKVKNSDLVRVMIVDDSAVVRGLVSRWLSEEDDLLVVEKCSNGKIALDKIADAQPDIVVLDIEMPVMDGLEALPELQKRAPRSKFLMASTLTQRNAEISLKALSLGATDYIAKPEGNRGVTTSEDFRKELIKRIRAIGGKGKRLRAPASANRTEVEKAVPGVISVHGSPGGQAPTTLKSFSLVKPRALVIGSSTGGPQALMTLLAHISPHLNDIPTLITQHMPPTFTKILAQNLARSLDRTVKEGEQGEILQSGHIYVAPGEHHMLVEEREGRVSIVLDDGPQVNYCRPAVDPMSISAAKVFKAGMLNIILTGMGHDGAEGVKAVSAVGGSVIAQDEESSVVWGMPGAAAATGCCSAVLPLNEIGPKTVSLIRGI